MFKSIHPFDQTQFAEFEPDSKSIVEKKLQRAAVTFKSWREETFNTRAEKMRRAGSILREKKNEFAKIITGEMGKVLSEAVAEVEKSAAGCEYFADNAERFLKDEYIETEASKSLVAYQPLGPVLAIMPWNFPFWQVFRFAAPALMAGNVGLLKHAANVTQCSLAIEKIFKDAGFPDGVFQSLIVESKDVDGIISREEVAAVTLTGSEFAGTQVGSSAGRNLKKSVLELGGSDPFIVLDDADLEFTAKIACQSRMQNAGQSCIAAKRFIVADKIENDFLDLFRKHVEDLNQGDPFNSGTTTGPMARIDLAEEVEKQMKKSIEMGARLVTGGSRRNCNFVPAIIDNVKPGMPAFDEEVFGPVAAVITVKNEVEAAQMANASRYGLGASVWTRDKTRGEKLARSIDSGCVFVNSLMRSDQRLPFGGIKKSGYGRELSYLGIREFVNAKSLYIA